MRYTAHHFTDDGRIPNHPTLPLLVYPQALDTSGPDPAAVAEMVFRRNGWGGAWRNGIYDFHHFHSTAHEVLAVVRGQATVQLGGEDGITFTVSAGDMLVLPAGTGHKRLPPVVTCLSSEPTRRGRIGICAGVSRGNGHRF